jgi:hypothetical protein
VKGAGLLYGVAGHAVEISKRSQIHQGVSP